MAKIITVTRSHFMGVVTIRTYIHTVFQPLSDNVSVCLCVVMIKTHLLTPSDKAFSAWMTDWSTIQTLWNVTTKQITSGGLQIIQLPLKLTDYSKYNSTCTNFTNTNDHYTLDRFYFSIHPTSLQNKRCNVTWCLTLPSTEYSISSPADHVITQDMIICKKESKTTKQKSSSCFTDDDWHICHLITVVMLRHTSLSITTIRSLLVLFWLLIVWGFTAELLEVQTPITQPHYWPVGDCNNDQYIQWNKSCKVTS